jgi:hypothetical protein
VPTLGQYLGGSPPSSEFPFVFTDESGVVWKSPTEPFYGIGMLKVCDAGRWSDELNLRLDRLVSGVQERQKRADDARLLRGDPVPLRPRFKRSHVEFHFSEITTWNRNYYEDLIDFFAAETDGYFSALVVDKTKPGVDPITACGTTWDALIKYSVTLLSKRITDEEKAIVISDNYQKPRKSPQYYERQIITGLRGKAANAVMIESSACVLLQLVDVLLGCVMYHYKAPRLPNIDNDKKLVADRLAAVYKVPTLAGGNWRRTQPNHFDVWDFQPRTAASKSGP